MASLRVLSVAFFLVIANGIESKRVKRDMEFEEVACVFLCLSENFNSSAFETYGDNGGSAICKHATIKNLNQVCELFKRGKSCLMSSCSKDNPLKNMIVQLLTYACEEHYPEFQKYTPCFTNSCSYIENSCRTKCGDAEDAVHYSSDEKNKLDAIRSFKTARDGSRQTTESSGEGLGSFDMFENLNIASACRYVSCYLNCSQDPLTERCGADTYKFFKNTVVDLAPLILGGFSPNTTSPPCQEILQMSHDQSQPTSTPSSSWTLHAPSILTLIVSLAIALIRK